MVRVSAADQSRRSWSGQEYVALGSSYAAGPGVGEPDPEAPEKSGRSLANYAHLVAETLELRLRDVTFSGATTASILTESQEGEPPQIDAVRPTTRLVTVTIGGNDVGYVGALGAASLPTVLRRLPGVGRTLRSALDRDERDRALRLVEGSIRRIVAEVRTRAPEARVLLVDYPTVLPADDLPSLPFSTEDAALGRHIAAGLERATAAAAAEAGADLIRASEASRFHHAWSPEPWTTDQRGVLPFTAGDPFHPTETGMRGVAALIIDHLTQRGLTGD